MNRSTWLMFALMISVFPASLFARTWKTADGKFTVEAEFVEATGPNVKLRKTDGKEITVMMSLLSQADRDFVIAEKKKAAAAATKPVTPAGDSVAPIPGRASGSRLPAAGLPAAGPPAEESEPPFNPAAEAAAQAALEKLGAKCETIGLEPGKPIFSVDFDDEKFKTGDVARAIPHLKQLPYLRDLHLAPGATDPDFKVIAELKGLKKLEEVEATLSQVTDAAFLELKALPTLNSINVIGAKKVTKEGAQKALQAMPRLEVIYIEADDGIRR